VQLDLTAFLEVVRNTPLVSVDLIVRDERDRVLLGLRKNAPARHSWFTPGGRIRKNERILDAVRRVALDELGVRLAEGDARPVGVFEHLYPDHLAGDDFGTHYVVLAFELRIAGERIAAADDQHREFRWFEPDRLLSGENVHPNVKAFFDSPVL